MYYPNQRKVLGTLDWPLQDVIANERSCIPESENGGQRWAWWANDTREPIGTPWETRLVVEDPRIVGVVVGLRNLG